MKKAPSSNRWLALARGALLAWVLISVVSTLVSLPARYQVLLRLEPSTVTQTPFYGWTSDQLRTAIQDLHIRPEWLAGLRLSVGLVCLLCFWVVGCLIFWRRSDNWGGLLSAFILFSTGPGFSGLFISQSQIYHWAKAFDTLTASIIWPTFFLMLYLFPNFRFEPRFTRILAPLPYLGFLLAGLLSKSTIALTILQLMILSYSLGGIASQVYRYRKISTPEERQQSKWVVYALGILIITTFTQAIFPIRTIGKTEGFWYELIVNGVIGTLLPALIPLALGMSILRYRLWDIDILIRRTLSYAILTALLGLGYLAAVTGLQALASTFGGQQSAAVTVISTLAIATLFTPLRRVVQELIDRRFYRRKINSEKALARFAAAARSGMELEQLSTSLTGTVQATLQPEKAGLWLRGPRGKHHENPV